MNRRINRILRVEVILKFLKTIAVLKNKNFLIGFDLIYDQILIFNGVVEDNQFFTGGNSHTVICKGNRSKSIRIGDICQNLLSDRLNSVDQSIEPGIGIRKFRWICINRTVLQICRINGNLSEHCLFVILTFTGIGMLPLSHIGGRNDFCGGTGFKQHALFKFEKFQFFHYPTSFTHRFGIRISGNDRDIIFYRF